MGAPREFTPHIPLVPDTRSLSEDLKAVIQFKDNVLGPIAIALTQAVPATPVCALDTCVSLQGHLCFVGRALGRFTRSASLSQFPGPQRRTRFPCVWRRRYSCARMSGLRQHASACVFLVFPCVGVCTHLGSGLYRLENCPIGSASAGSLSPDSRRRVVQTTTGLFRPP